MRVKGKNLHVFPNDTGWCVVSEANRNITQHFSTEEEALAFGHQCATRDESELLVHTATCKKVQPLSSVALPEREYLPGQGRVDMSAQQDHPPFASGRRKDRGKPGTRELEKGALR